MTMNDSLVWLGQLQESRAQVLSAARSGKLDLAALESLANNQAGWSLSLDPMPINPVEHLHAAHAQASTHLQRLATHAPDVMVPAGNNGFVYTPRKVLRRVLDHLIDHSNQVEQWVAWQHRGITPTPADGWAGSAVTLGDDLIPLTQPELDAWLWRIQAALQTLEYRISELSPTELNWTPPNGEWSLNQVLHHLASSETFYVGWLDDALPLTPIARYDLASQHLYSRLAAVAEKGIEPTHALFGDDVDFFTPAQVAQLVLTREKQLLTQSDQH